MKNLAILSLFISLTAQATITCSSSVGSSSFRNSTHTITTSFLTKHSIYQISHTQMTRAGERITTVEALYSMAEDSPGVWKLSKEDGSSSMSDEITLVATSHALPGRVCYPNDFCKFIEVELKNDKDESLMKCKTDTIYGVSL